MIDYPNCKINIGLNVLSKKSNGYHDISSILYPIKTIKDILEIIPSNNFSFKSSGLDIKGNIRTNLCVKAYHILKKEFDIPPVKIYLHKQIPMGAGIGGGSSDGAFTLKMINQLFNLNLNTSKLEYYASLLGSDCSFFIKNQPALVSEVGNILECINLDLSKYKIKFKFSDHHISTKIAYSLIKPNNTNNYSLNNINTLPLKLWKQKIKNDFELPIFKKHPEIKANKIDFYKEGAKYAAMSGSGSVIYGIF